MGIPDDWVVQYYKKKSVGAVDGNTYVPNPYARPFKSPIDDLQLTLAGDREAVDEARVEQLKDDLHYCKGVCDLALKHRNEAEARVAELEAALKPFAETAQYINETDPRYPDTAAVMRPMFDVYKDGVRVCVTYGDLRRAAKALAPTEKE
jgi:hypothetical protein